MKPKSIAIVGGAAETSRLGVIPDMNPARRAG
jgi:hypothetical protein